MWILQPIIFTIKRCGPNHYTTHTFFSGLDQFHYIDIWASDWGHVATIGGTLMDWFSDTIYHNHGKPSNGPYWAFFAIRSND